jgi:hypothetical protein
MVNGGAGKLGMALAMEVWCKSAELRFFVDQMLTKMLQLYRWN